MKKHVLILLAASSWLLASCQPSTVETPAPTPQTAEAPSPTPVDTVQPTATTVATHPPTPMPAPTTPPTSPPPSTPVQPDGETTADGTCVPLDDATTASYEILEDPDFDQKILDYINAGGSIEPLKALSAPASVSEPVYLQIVSQDVTLDGVPEIIAAVTRSYHVDVDGEAHVLLFTCSAGRYESVVLFRRAGAGSRRSGLYSGRGARVLSIRDLNQNTVPDLVFSVNWPGYTEYYVAEWNGAEFASLIEYEDPVLMMPSYRIEALGSDLEITDTDGDGVFELVLTYPLPPDEPQNTARRVQTVIWGWNGETYTIASARHTPPRYRFQAIYDGDLAFQREDYAEALAFYQQAIADDALWGWNPAYDVNAPDPPAPDPDERPRLTAYAYYRTLLVHVTEGDVDKARRVYDVLQRELPAGAARGPYAELAASFWEAYAADEHRDAVAACTAAQAHAAANAEAVLTPLRSGHQGYYKNAGLVSDRPYVKCVPDYTPYTLCPFASP